MAKVIGYIRGTSDMAYPTLETQKREILEAFPHAVVYGDDGTDAHIPKFMDRPAGQLVDRQLSRGDTVVFARMNRGFRMARDFIECFDIWEQRGVRVTVLDFEPLDLLMWRRLVEYERLCRREIMWASLEVRKRFGAHRGTPLGFKWVGHRGRRKLIPDLKEQAAMALIVRLRDEGHSYASIKLQLDRAGVSEYALKGHRRYFWDLGRIRRGYVAGKRLQAGSSPTLPPS